MDEKTLLLLTERIIDNTNAINEKILKSIGEKIGKIKTLNYTEAHQIAQIYKYGTEYNKIIEEIKKVSGINERDIKQIFNAVAKENEEFSEQFFKYKDMPVATDEINTLVNTQIEAYSRNATNGINNLINSSMIGYSIKDSSGNIIFKNVRDVYDDIIDKAVLSVFQGKSTFDKEMRDTIKQLGTSGLKTIDYESGISRRLDSVVRMHMMDNLRNLTNEVQNIYGESYGADGVEISVHENPANDHADVQGRQFTKEQFNLLQTTGNAKDVNGKSVTIYGFTKKGKSKSFRPISMYNCYHYTFNIIVGISEPLYSEEEINEIKKTNMKGFELDGRHYTNYEGTQLQRNLERKIREQKDIQILARNSGDKQLAKDAQTKINQLTNKYKELSDISGLPTKKDRLSVSGYRKIKVKDIIKKQNTKDLIIETPTKRITSEKMNEIKVRSIIDNKKTLNELKLYLDINHNGKLNKCKEVSDIITKKLNNEGIKAETINVTPIKNGTFKTNGHYVTLSGEKTYDYTWQQYFKENKSENLELKVLKRNGNSFSKNGKKFDDLDEAIEYTRKNKDEIVLFY